MNANERKWKSGYFTAIWLAIPILAYATFGDEPRVPSPESRTIEDKVIYFVMLDRFSDGDPSNNTGGIAGDRYVHGYDPTDKGFFHGGDLKGLTQKLDYIQGLGATAIWLAPVFKNKPVQGPAGQQSAGYHGYWITDFTRINPHFGSNAEFKALVDAAHARGIKVILDIVTNHTADVIQFRECVDDDDLPIGTGDECPYRSITEYPWTTRGGPDGQPINEGFIHPGSDTAGESHWRTEENFSRLIDPNWAYTPFVAEHEANIKYPAWLKDPIYYHNRGNSHWRGESVLYGDFAGLDDLFTEHPRVVQGMIEIYKHWISEYRIDGFRVDTVKHVNDEFWLEFVPAIMHHAHAEGIENFYMFGETFQFDPAEASFYTREIGFPAVLDFAFQQALREVIVESAPPSRLAELFEQDPLYTGDASDANLLPTFTGNHDMGRIGHFLIQAQGKANPGSAASEEALLKRAILAHALLFFTRGVPVIYYGDEQGFTGHGGDRDARQNMFPSRVASYNDNRLIGTAATTADDNFDRDHPLYRAIADMARVFHAEPGLRRGRQQVVLAEQQAGLFASTRRLEHGPVYLFVFNNAVEPRTNRLEITDSAYPRHKAQHKTWSKLIGTGPETIRSQAGILELSLPGLSFAVYRSRPSDASSVANADRGHGP